MNDLLNDNEAMICPICGTPMIDFFCPNCGFDECEDDEEDED